MASDTYFVIEAGGNEAVIGHPFDQVSGDTLRAANVRPQAAVANGQIRASALGDPTLLTHPGNVRVLIDNLGYFQRGQIIDSSLLGVRCDLQRLLDLNAIALI
jgi:hypothetical protein